MRTAKHLVLVYGDERRWEARKPQGWEQVDEGHRALSAAAGSGAVGAGQLQGADTVTTVRADSSGRVSTIDEPFLESKEALGGFYLLEAAHLDEVLELVI